MLTITDQIMSLLSEFAILLPAFLLVFTFRGFFKALFAKLMGDDTAYHDGFLTLNPLVHIDFIGLLVMLFFLFFLGGLLIGVVPKAYLFILLILTGARWTYNVPINENNFRHYNLGIIFTTIAGSIGNFILALIFLYFIAYLPYNLLPDYIIITLAEIFRMIIELAVFFGVIDLLPIPPFDGGRLLKVILPVYMHHFIEILERFSLFILLILFFIPVISDIFFRILFILSILVKKFLLFLVI
ncbi:hypothetical protein GF322_00170 [Candidatus Dependentiae bacterium]|nr:hypothetical protein [Candidatus Dependentiae bacterium]